MPKSSLIIPFFLLCFCSFLSSQSLAASENLVVNPSFETLDSKTQKLLDPLKRVIEGIDPLERIIGWKSATIGRAEIYGTDENGWIEDISSARGQRNFKAKTGKHVARLSTIDRWGQNGTASWLNWALSYLQNELSDSLIVGQKYYIGFWSHFHCLATNNICMAFSTKSVQSDTANRLNLVPQAHLKAVINYDRNNIWHLTVDSFIADKPYKYCIIGNFLSFDSLRLGGSKGFDHYVAFVDDVFVTKAKNNFMHNTTKLPQLAKLKRPLQNQNEPPQLTKLTHLSSLLKVLNQVHFLYNSAEFDVDSQPQLDSAAAVLKRYLTLEIFIKGHTSSEGNAEYNLKLSEKRAEAIKNYLIQKGIEAKRMTTQGFGEMLPLVPDNSEDNKRLNRRIEFEILKE